MDPLEVAKEWQMHEKTVGYSKLITEQLAFLLDSMFIAGCQAQNKANIESENEQGRSFIPAKLPKFNVVKEGLPWS